MEASVEVWRALSYLGTEAFYVLLCTLLYIAWSPRKGMALLSATALGAATTLYLKQVLHMPRPPPSTWLAPAYGYGFPSGHALVSSAFWTSLTVASGRLALAALATAVVVAVSVSRVELHVHYVRDVVGGALIGLSIGVAIAKLFERRWLETLVSVSAIATAMSLATLLAPAPGLSQQSIEMGERYCYTVAGISAALPLYIAVERRIDEERYRSLSPFKRVGLAIAVAIAVTAAALAATKHLGYPPTLLPAFIAITSGVIASPLLISGRR